MANIVSVGVLANFFGKDERTIQIWAKEYGMPKTDRGEYDFVACTKWRITYLEQELERAKQGDLTVAELERKNKQLLIRKKEMEINEMDKKLISIEEIKDLLIDLVVVFSSSLTSLRTKLAPKLIGKTDKKEIELVITDTTDLIRANIGKMEHEILKKYNIDTETDEEKSENN